MRFRSSNVWLLLLRKTSFFTTQRIDSNLFPSTRLLCIQIVMSSLPLARRKKDCSNLEFLNFQVESVTLGHLVSFEKWISKIRLHVNKMVKVFSRIRDLRHFDKMIRAINYRNVHDLQLILSLYSMPDNSSIHEKDTHNLQLVACPSIFTWLFCSFLDLKLLRLMMTWQSHCLALSQLCFSIGHWYRVIDWNWLVPRYY